MLRTPTETKYYIDNEGNYIGGFAGLMPLLDDEGEIIIEGEFPEVPEGAIEVPEAPVSASYKWVNGAWVSPEAEVMP